MVGYMHISREENVGPYSATQVLTLSARPRSPAPMPPPRFTGMRIVIRIFWSSVTLPVSKGADYKVATNFSHGNPVVDLYWTAIVPNTRLA